MSIGEKRKQILLFVLSVSLIATALTAFFVSEHDSRMQFKVLADFCGKLIERDPDQTSAILEVLKSKEGGAKALEEENILTSFGYRQSDFTEGRAAVYWMAGAGFAVGSALFLAAFWYWHKKSSSRIRMLTDYLAKINSGGEEVLLDIAEDDHSRLQDEIYKTVTMLYQTRDAALEAKKNFADNLSNIAHQLKTPITAISLSNQMMERRPCADYTEQIRRQLGRLTYLEEALLLLSRIDAGALTLERRAVDVFTVLTLAADNLQELFAEAGVLIDIPEMGEADIAVDLDWTMEAVINLLKNCMEHTPQGTSVHCSYEKNPLYVRIRIWDEGAGIAKEDQSRLFERFYRGKGAKDTGIGIGLCLAKAIIEMQDGVVSAYNLPAGGACFDIRFYSH